MRDDASGTESKPDVRVPVVNNEAIQYLEVRLDIIKELIATGQTLGSSKASPWSRGSGVDPCGHPACSSVLRSSALHPFAGHIDTC